MFQGRRLVRVSSQSEHPYSATVFCCSLLRHRLSSRGRTFIADVSWARFSIDHTYYREDYTNGGSSAS